MTVQNTNRYIGIDIIKFVMAIIVVSIHTIPFSNMPNLNDIYMKVIADTAVPFFFAVSGFFIGNKSWGGYVVHYAICLSYI